MEQIEDRQELSKKTVIARITAFMLVFLLIFVTLGRFMKPAWTDWNVYNTFHGFYNEPDNTIEVVFLGTSGSINGYIPMELYERYGICAHGLASESQPMLATYYWLKEIYKYHSESLKVVILDPSMLRQVPNQGAHRIALDDMKLSANKIQAYSDYATNFEDALSYIVPLLSYHDRWASLTQADVDKGAYEPSKYTRGYNFTLARYLDQAEYYALHVPTYILNENEKSQDLIEEAVSYFEKIVDFCNEHQLKLTVVRGPSANWSAAAHNAVEELAEKAGVDFLDFNYEPLIDEVEYNRATDSIDGTHLNYFGATKLTNWMGEYLITECNVTDIRGNAKYEFMERELEEYHAKVTDIVALKTITDPAEYLSFAMQIPNCVVFLSAKDEATAALSEEQRKAFGDMGLSKLSSLTLRDSYLGIIQNGTVCMEQSEEWDIDKPSSPPLSSSGKLYDNLSYTIISGGYCYGNISSILVNGAEYSANSRGLNIVVYNSEYGFLVDSACFDTYASASKAGDVTEDLKKALASGISYMELPDNLKKLYLYNRRCENSRMSSSLNISLGDQDVLTFLESYWNKKDYVILITVRNDANELLGSLSRRKLYSLGLTELSELDQYDSYVAMIDSGTIIYEIRSQENEPIFVSGINYSLTSGGLNSGDVSSIFINNWEYSYLNKGMDIVIFDKQLRSVVDQATFECG